MLKLPPIMTLLLLVAAPVFALSSGIRRTELEMCFDGNVITWHTTEGDGWVLPTTTSGYRITASGGYPIWNSIRFGVFFQVFAVKPDYERDDLDEKWFYHGVFGPNVRIPLGNYGLLPYLKTSLGWFFHISEHPSPDNIKGRLVFKLEAGVCHDVSKSLSIGTFAGYSLFRFGLEDAPDKAIGRNAFTLGVVATLKPFLKR